MESPQFLYPSSSGRRRSSDSNSPEFEFWIGGRNPSFPDPNLLSADELFADGVLLPLHHHHHSHDPPDPLPEPPNIATTSTNSDPIPDSVTELSRPTDSLISGAFTASKRWKDIFKKKLDSNTKNHEDKEKEKKKDRKGGGGGGTSTAELNINLWPFSRSRSAGTGGSRPRTAATRKVSSAPCSRSNSAGESKSRKWPSSPSRGGVHLGRSSPVWKVRRSGSGRTISDTVVRNAEKGIKKEGPDTCRRKIDAAGGGGVGGGGGGGAKAKVLNLNVPMCIGYRHHLSCRSDENAAVSVLVAAGNPVVASQTAVVSSSDGGRGSNLFNLRNLFAKKLY